MKNIGDICTLETSRSKAAKGSIDSFIGARSWSDYYMGFRWIVLREDSCLPSE